MFKKEVISIFICLCIPWIAFAKEKSIHNSVFFKDQTYLGNIHPQFQRKHYWNFGTQFEIEKKFKDWFVDLKLKIQLSPLFLPEQLITFKGGVGFKVLLDKSSFIRDWIRHISVSIGRFSYDWSWLSKEWELGLWNVRNIVDPLQPEDLGLLGLHLSVKGKKWTFTHFVSGIHIPDESYSGGQFYYSKSNQPRWQSPLERKMRLTGRVLPIHYELYKYDVLNLIFKPSYLLKFNLDDDQTWLSFTYAYKPINTLVFQVRPEVLFTQDQVRVNIRPFLMLHHLVSLEAGWRQGNWDAKLGFSGEILDKSELELLSQKWLTPYVDEGAFIGGSITKKFRFLTIHRLSFSMLYSVLNPINQEDGSLSSIVVSPVIYRFKLKNGMTISWDTMWNMKSDSQILFDLKFWYSLSNQAWLETVLKYQYSEKSYIYFRMDTLGSSFDTVSGYMSAFGYNDRIELGIYHDI